MHHATSTLHFRHPFPGTSAGAIEWEELPSLAGSLAKRLLILGSGGPQAANTANGAGVRSAGTPWDSTRPAELESPVASQPFREPLQGVAIREVNEPDIFRHFFGS